MQLNISLEQNDRYQLIVDIFEKFFQINDQLIQSQPVMLRESLTMEIVRYAFHIYEQLGQQGANQEDEEIQR